MGREVQVPHSASVDTQEELLGTSWKIWGFLISTAYQWRAEVILMWPPLTLWVKCKADFITTTLWWKLWLSTKLPLIQPQWAGRKWGPHYYQVGVEVPCLSRTTAQAERVHFHLVWMSVPVLLLEFLCHYSSEVLSKCRLPISLCWYKDRVIFFCPVVFESSTMVIV